MHIVLFPSKPFPIFRAFLERLNGVVVIVDLFLVAGQFFLEFVDLPITLYPVYQALFSAANQNDSRNKARYGVLVEQIMLAFCQNRFEIHCSQWRPRRHTAKVQNVFEGANALRVYQWIG